MNNPVGNKIKNQNKTYVETLLKILISHYRYKPDVEDKMVLLATDVYARDALVLQFAE